MQNCPLVSIVIIAYNEERYLSAAIESALAQTYENIEVIVVDDGSKDSTLEVAKSFVPKINVISQTNSGNCSFPRNAGLAIAKGEYISFLDGDDVLLPNKIAMQVELLLQHPEAAFVVNDYCNFRDLVQYPNHFSTCPLLMTEFESAQTDTLLLPKGRGADIMLEENFTIASSPLFRTSIVRSIGGFSTILYACEDFHLNYRVASRFQMLVNRELLFRRRLHGTNMSSNSMKMAKYYALSRLLLLSNETDKERRRKLKKITNGYATRFLKCCVKELRFKSIPAALKMKIESIIF